MDKILNTYKEIQLGNNEKSKKLLSLTIVLVVMVICFSIASVKMFKMAQLNTLILEYDGYERTAHNIHPDSAYVIKSQAFIDDWCQHFFAFTPNSHLLEEKLKYATDLGDNTVKNAYLHFRSNNWYNDILQNNLEQTIKFTKNTAIPSKNGVKFYVKAIITLSDYSGTGQSISYKLDFTCTAVEIKPSYPKARFGLFIKNFKFDLTEM